MPNIFKRLHKEGKLWAG